MEEYDAIIIGAGIGGLSCGALLAKGGCKTLVLEQYHNVGGCCSTFREKGFSFNLAADFLLEGPSLILQNLEELGVEDKIEFIQINPLYEIIFPDFKIEVPKDVGMFSEELIKIAPEERKNINNFLHTVIDIYNIIEKIRFNPSYDKRNLLTNIIKHPEFIKYVIPYGKMNWNQFLDRYFTNKKLKAVLSVESIFLGLPPSRIPVFAMAAIIAMEHKYGLVYPKKGMISLAEAYVSALEKYNGELRLDSKVTKILIENNKCQGVELANGEKIFSEVVVSNAEIRETFFNLVGKKYLDKNFSDRVELLEPSLSAFKLCIGTDIKPEIEPLVLKCTGYDIEKIHKEILKNGVLADNYYLMCTPSLLDPSIAQNGTHNIEILIVTPNQIKGKMWSELNQAEHETLKRKFTDTLIKDIIRIIPGLSNHIIYKEAITPLMLEKKANRYNGQTCIHINILDKVAGNKTPIKNLYSAGSSAYPGDGISNTIVSGTITSNIILNALGRLT